MKTMNATSESPTLRAWTPTASGTRGWDSCARTIRSIAPGATRAPSAARAARTASRTTTHGFEALRLGRRLRQVDEGVHRDRRHELRTDRGAVRLSDLAAAAAQPADDGGVIGDRHPSTDDREVAVDRPRDLEAATHSRCASNGRLSFQPMASAVLRKVAVHAEAATPTPTGGRRSAPSTDRPKS